MKTGYNHALSRPKKTFCRWINILRYLKNISPKHRKDSCFTVPDSEGLAASCLLRLSFENYVRFSCLAAQQTVLNRWKNSFYLFGEIKTLLLSFPPSPIKYITVQTVILAGQPAYRHRLQEISPSVAVYMYIQIILKQFSKHLIKNICYIPPYSI